MNFRLPYRFDTSRISTSKCHFSLCNFVIMRPHKKNLREKFKKVLTKHSLTNIFLQEYVVVQTTMIFILVWSQLIDLLEVIIVFKSTLVPFYTLQFCNYENISHKKNLEEKFKKEYINVLYKKFKECQHATFITSHLPIKLIRVISNLSRV